MLSATVCVKQSKCIMKFNTNTVKVKKERKSAFSNCLSFRLQYDSIFIFQEIGKRDLQHFTIIIVSLFNFSWFNFFRTEPF